MTEFLNLGNYLKEQRVEAEMTQSELSQKLKVHVQFVSNWERGLCAPPSHCFEKALDVLKCDRNKVVEYMLQDSKKLIESKVFKKKKGKAG